MRMEVVRAGLTLTDTFIQAAREIGLDLVDNNAEGSQGEDKTLVLF